MRNLLGVCNDAQGTLDEAGTGRFVGWIDQGGIGFEALAQHHLGREPVEHTLPTTVVGEATQPNTPSFLPTLLIASMY